MAAFVYLGMARIQWDETRATKQFIYSDPNTDTLEVWPEDETIEEPEYVGTMRHHPSQRIEFLHC